MLILFADLFRVLFGKAGQLLHQFSVMGINFGGVLGLIVEELSEKNNYPSKSEEYMANQVFYQIFFG